MENFIVELIAISKALLMVTINVVVFVAILMVLYAFIT